MNTPTNGLGENERRLRKCSQQPRARSATRLFNSALGRLDDIGRLDPELLHHGLQSDAAAFRELAQGAGSAHVQAFQLQGRLLPLFCSASVMV